MATGLVTTSVWDYIFNAVGVINDFEIEAPAACQKPLQPSATFMA